MGFYFNTNSITPSGGSGGGSSNTNWGDIGGTLSNQTDLNTALSAKQNTLTAGDNVAITNDVISVTGALINYGTVMNAIAIGESTDTTSGHAQATTRAIAIGGLAEATYTRSIAIGNKAKATAEGAIQLGSWGTANERGLFIGLAAYNNYKLLGSDGKIPNERLSAFTGATSSVAGSVGAVPAPTTSDVNKYLKGDGTWGTVSSSGLQNMATGLDSLSILETTTGGGSVNIGIMDDPSTSNNHDGTVSVGTGTYTGGDCDTVVGNSARAYGTFSTAIGNSAYCWQSNSIQIGTGENYDAKTFYVGFFDSNPDYRYNYKLLDGATGKIPNDRINGVSGSFTTNDGKTVTVTNGVITSIV